MQIRKLVLASAALAVMSTAASAQAYVDHRPVAPAVGVAAGTVAGLATYHAWAGPTFLGTVWPTGVAGAMTTGLVGGVAAGALIHAATTPCQGYHALLGNLFTSAEGCVNGQWVGYGHPAVGRPMPRR